MQHQELGLPILFSPPHYPLSNQTSLNSSYQGTQQTGRARPPSQLSQDSLAQTGSVGLYSLAVRPTLPAYSQLQVPSTANWGSMKRRHNGGVAEYNAPLSLHTPADPPSIHFDRGSYSTVSNMMCQKD